jgi:hypothetical protein
MAEWIDAELNIPGGGALADFTSGLQSFLSNAQRINTDVIFPLLRLIQTLQTRQDAAAFAAQAALDAIRNILADFLKDAGGYLLIVPLLKPFARAVGPPELLLEDIQDLVSLNTLLYPADALIGDGGNYGLYRKIVESIYDRADLSRPDFPDDAYVSGAIMVFGSDTYLNTVNGLLTLQNVFGDSVPMPLDNFSVPVPQNIKARPISVSNRKTLSGISVIEAEVIPVLGAPQTPPNFDIHVKWDPEPVTRAQPAYGRFRYTITQWTLYVKPEKKIQQGEDLAQYAAKSTQVLNTNIPITGQLLTGTIYQAVIRNLDPTLTYWVSVAYTVQVEDQDEGTTQTFEPSFTALSAQRRVRIQELAPVTQFMDGEPPDWLAIASPLAPFPQVRQAFAQAQNILDLLETSLVNLNNAASDQLDFLEDQLEFLAQIIEDLNNTTNLVQNTFNGVDIGIYAATFSGRGSASYFTSTIGELLLDEATVNRPPFDRGDEAVGAMVFLNVSETAAGAADFLALINTFIGDTSVNTGFTVNDVNRIPYVPPTAAEGEEEAEDTGPAPLSDLGVGEDPC